MLKEDQSSPSSVAANGPAVIRRAGAGLDWKSFAEALEAARRATTKGQPREATAAELAYKFLSPLYVACIRRAADGKLRCELERCAVADQLPALRSTALAASVEFASAAQATPALIDKQRYAVVSQVESSGNGASWLVAVFDCSANLFLASNALRLIALDVWMDAPADRPNKNELDSRISAAVLGLAVRLASAADAKTGTKLLADLLCQHLGAERVAVGLVQPRQMTVKLVAMSHVERLDRHTEAVRLIETCLTESLPLAPLVSWSRGTEQGSLSSSKSWTQLSSQWQAPHLAALRLVDRDGGAIAACLVARQDAADSRGECFLTLAGQLAGPLLSVLQRGTFKKWLADCRSRLPAWLLGWWIWLAVAALAVPAWYPWETKTRCSVILEPSAHRLIVSPFEGIFDRSEVMPGDEVQAGQLMGRMEGRELRTRLAGLEAEIARASKSRDTNLVAGKLADAQIDRLQTERSEHERSVILQRLKQLDIRSPIAGIVVSGDLTRHQGATVKVGQPLYEVAPLDRLVAELAVPEEDLEYVATGTTVFVRLDALSGASWQGSIERIHPRAETRDNRQVFIAESSFANAGELRPGMKGMASIVGPRAPGIWLLTRKPLNSARRFLGW